MRCKAKSKRSGEQCKRSAVVGREVCAVHGGKSPKGAASALFKTGKYSKYLPARMLAAYESSLNDPQLLDLKQSVALIDARLTDLLSRVDSGESGALWMAVVGTYNHLRKTYRGGDHVQIMKAFAVMDEVINKAIDDYAAWGEIGQLLDARRKHVETQQRVELQGERAVPAEQLMTFMGAVLHLIQTSVSSQQEKQRIADGIDRLITTRSTIAQ